MLSALRNFRRRQHRSISDRLVLVMATAVAGVLLLAGGAGMTYMYVEERQEVAQHLRAQAELLASQSIAPILFDDPETMRATLLPLKYVENVRWAAVIVADREFAAFGEVPAALSKLRARMRQEGEAEAAGGSTLMERGQVVIAQPVRNGERDLGTLYVLASFEKYDASFLKLIAAFAGLASLVIVLTLPALAFVVRQMTRPLRKLALLADDVTRRGDLGARVRVGSSADGDEVNQLAVAFNGMLDALRERERTLAWQASELESSARQLRALNAKTNRIREDERTRIAREIHDELGQLMTRLKFDVAWIRDHAGNSAMVAGRASEMASFLDQAVQTVRRISWELRPSILDTLGLSAAVEWLAEDFSRRTGVHCRADVQALPAEIDAEFASNVFRIGQELLTNVARHAQSSELNVVLGFVAESGEVCLIVEDNGVSMPADAEHGHTLGLLGIRERVRYLGGKLHLLTRPEFPGTSVTVTLPSCRSDGGQAQERSDGQERAQE